MADIFTAEKRSSVMALVRGFGNASTELRLAKELRHAGITGWRRHQKLPGRPDFSFRKEKLAVFVDGDFWHGNPKRKMPSTNVEFWALKIGANRARDQRANKDLKKLGWKVLRIWESKLKKEPWSVTKRIKRRLQRS